MPTIKTWPILTLRLEGGPDDGEVRLMPAMVSVVPPERLESSVDSAGAYLRDPTVAAPGTWR